MTNQAAERIAVIIGVGQVNDRPADAVRDGLDSFGLMQAALEAAQADCGASILGQLDWLGVEDQISFPEPSLHERLAASLPRRPANVVKTADASGDGPTRLINDAANLIGEGRISIAAAVGAEAMRTANKRAQAEAANADSGAKVNKLADLAESLAGPIARRYGLLTPIDVYPLYENATRASWGQSRAEAQAETAEIWSGFSRVAAENPHAWLRTELAPEAIATPSPDNRMLSYPYTKLMVANNSVNMGAAVIVASLARARELGIPEDRLVYVGAGAGAHEDEDFLRRDSYDHSASLTASIEKALEYNGLTVGDLDHVELYSCFPCVPKMARRVLGWPLERAHSVYGGLTFGGGPIGNCMMHAAAAMVEKLRIGGRHGLIVSNGGYASHNHSLVLGRVPPHEPRHPQEYNVQAVADGLRKPVPDLLDQYEGPGIIETFIAPYGRAGKPAFATIVARTPSGERFLATVLPEDTATLALLTSGEAEPVGMAGHAVALADGRSQWRR
ncbi:MAG: acetyl-CoA acetyltransferase [Sphingomonadaceae bacterium]